MRSPVNKPNEKKPEIADDALIGKSGPRPLKSSRRVWWSLLLATAAVPLALTLFGAATSPPHVSGVPNGQLVYMEADAPSEKTTTLRGLFIADPGGATRLLLHETEPQDIDAGARDWITQPTLSPDGTQVAFEKQLITIGEDKQSVDNQIWVMPTAPGTRNPPHMVMDLTAQKLKQVVGLAWDSDSSLLFLEDGVSYSVPTDTDDPPLKSPLDLHGLKLVSDPNVSATRTPIVTNAGTFAYGVQTPEGPQVLTQAKEQTTPGPAASLFALSPDGTKIAFVPGATSRVIRLYDIVSHASGPDIPIHWGWSVFGHREITSLRWSPDGSEIAYTVAKPPIPDGELFAVSPTTGRIVQLPYRTGRAAWDWGQ